MLALATAAGPALADPYKVDKTSPTNIYDNIGLSNVFSKTNACGCDPTFDSAFIDSFVVTGATHLTGVEAALVAIQQNSVSNWSGFGNTHGYQVNIYSSTGAASASITGDVYSKTFLPGEVSFGAGFTVVGDAAPYVVDSSLASLGIDANLSTGTYWVGVVGLDDRTTTNRSALPPGAPEPGSSPIPVAGSAFPAMANRRATASATYCWGIPIPLPFPCLRAGR